MNAAFPTAACLPPADVTGPGLPATIPDDGAPVAPRIVIVDDDPGIRELLTDYLTSHSLGAEAVASGAALRERLSYRPCDLIILDMMMPGEDGLSILRTLTSAADHPAVIMFSAVTSEVDRVVALELGADDYVSKPNSPREMLARVRAVLRRRGLANGGGEKEEAGSGTAPALLFTFAGWRLDRLSRRVVNPAGELVPLSDSEFEMMLLFVEEPHVVHSREKLADLLHSREGGINDRTIDVKVSRLRAKLMAGGGDEMVRTVRSRGYLFLPQVRAA